MKFNSSSCWELARGETIIRMITNTFDWFIALYGKVDSDIERNFGA